MEETSPTTEQPQKLEHTLLSTYIMMRRLGCPDNIEEAIQHLTLLTKDIKNMRDAMVEKNYLKAYQLLGQIQERLNNRGLA
jgi:hypothetical protein